MLEREYTDLGTAEREAFDQDRMWFINEYACSCGYQWESEWSCTVDEECPDCAADCSPADSTPLIVKLNGFAIGDKVQLTQRFSGHYDVNQVFEVRGFRMDGRIVLNRSVKAGENKDTAHSNNLRHAVEPQPEPEPIDYIISPRRLV